MRRLVSALAAMVLGMTVPAVAVPLPAQAATPPVAATAQALRASIKLLPAVLGGITLTAATPNLSWSTGQSAKSTQDGVTPLLGGVLGPTLLDAGLTKANAGPTSNGGGSSSEVAGLDVLGAVTADVIRSSCALTPTGISGGTTATGLKVAGLPVTVDADLAINVPGVLTGYVDRRIVSYNNSTGALTYTVRGVDLTLLGGLSVVASGTVVVTEAVCTGNAKISGGLGATGVSRAPGQTGTPTVTLTNTGDVAAPNTTIRIPMPGVGYQVGSVTTTGGGTCSTGGGYITCENITVPGNDQVTVSIPVTLSPSPGMTNWAPAAGAITASSDLVVGVGGTEATAATGSATTLVTVLPPLTTGGTITATPVSVAPGATGAASLAVKNNGPSDANASTVTVPLSTLPTGLTVTAASAAGQPCTVSPTTVTCTGVPVAANSSTPVTLTVAAGQNAVPGTHWDATNIAAVMNGTTVTLSDRLATVSPPDVRFTGGITLNGVSAVPGGASATFTAKFVNNGPSNSVGTTITFPPLPAGYTPGAVSTTGGGTCMSTSQALTCDGVLIPGGGGSVTVSVPVTLVSSVTSAWVATAGNRVSVSGSDSTAYATGTLVTPTPQVTLVPTFQMPAAETVEPGESTQFTVTIDNTGPSDANQAVFGVIAPAGTQFPSPLTGGAVNYCTRVTATQLSCKMDLTVAEAPKSFTVPLDVLASADPTTPVTGGCIDRDGSLNCTASDPAIPTIVLQVPFEENVTAVTLPTPVVPGTSSIGEIILSAGFDPVNDAVVTVPLGALPPGVTVVAATAGNGSNCVLTPAVTCTGVDIAEGGTTRVRLTIKADPDVAPAQTWLASGIVAAETDAPDAAKVTTTGPLATISARQNTLDVQYQVPAPGVVEPGDAFTVTVTVTNNGPSDAVAFPIQIVAPVNTVIGDRTNTPLATCILSAPGRLVCPRDIAFGDPLQLVVPLIASVTADPSLPLTSGCVDVGDHDLNCDPEDKKMPDIVMTPRFVDVVSVNTQPVTIAPGDSGSTTVVVNASREVDDIVVTIPLSSLPAGFTVTGVTPVGAGDDADCEIDVPNNVIRCTGITVGGTGQASISISVAVDVAADVAPTTQWTSTSITVAESPLPGADTLQAGGSLVQAGARDFDLDVSVDAPAADTVLPGGSTSLTVTIDNEGPSNALNAPVNVFAPVGTTFGDIAGIDPTGDVCTRVSSTQLACLITLAAADPPLELPIPLGVSASANAAAPLTGGCVDVDANLVCGAAPDVAVPAIDLDTPIGQVISITTLPTTVAPGAPAGTATVRLTSTQVRSGLTVEIPLDGLPSGFTVVPGSATGPSGACPITTVITCSNVSVAANQTVPVTFQVTVDPLVSTTAAWSTNGIKVTQSAPTAQVLSGGGPLVYAGAPNYTLGITWAMPAAGSVLPGGTGTVTATVRNNGPSAASNAVVPIILPPGTAIGTLTDQDAIDHCVKVSARVLNCVVTINAVNGTIGLDVPVVVAPTADPAVPLTGGCADLDLSGTCGTGTDSAMPSITLGRTLASVSGVTVTPTTVTPGATGTAALQFTATQAYANLTLTIPLASLPDGFDIASAKVGNVDCTVTVSEISCPVANLAPVTPRTVGIVVDVAADVPGGVSWTVPGFTLANGSDTVTRTGTLAVSGAPVHPLDVTIVGPAADTVRPGTEAVMSISIDNLGPSDAAGLPVSVVAPPGTSFDTLSGRAAQICQRVSNTRLLCGVTLAAAAMSPEAFDVMVLVSPNARGDVVITGGCVDLDSNGTCGPTDRNLPGIDPNILLVTAIDGHLDVVNLVPGSTGQAVLTLTGEEPVPGVVVTFPTNSLPVGVELLTVTAAGQPCAIANSQVTCPPVNVAENGGTPIVMTFKAAPDVSQSAFFAATITTTFQPGPDQQTDAQGGTIVQIAPPQVTLVADVDPPLDDTVLPGEQADLTISVTNSGPSTATNAPFSVVAPQGTTFVDPLDANTDTYCDRASPTQLDCWVTQNPNAPAIVLTPKIQIPANADLTTPPPPGCVDLNNDGACSGTDEPVPGVVPLAPLSAVSTMTTTAARVAPGDTGTATVTITATQALTGQTLRIPMTGRPAGFDVTAASVGATQCTIDPATEIVCTPVAVTPGTSTLVTLTVEVDASVTAVLEWRPTSITLSGSRGSTGISGPLAFSIEPEQNVTVTLGQPSRLRLTKNMTTIVPVTLKNNGPLDATPAIVDIFLPNGMELVTPNTLPCVSNGPGVITCTTNLLDQESKTFNLELKVSQTTPVGSKPSGGCVDEDTNGNCSGAEDDPMPTFEVAPSGADLTVRFEDPTIEAVRGADVEVALPIGNLGLDPAGDTELDIDLPLGVGVVSARRETEAATGQSMSQWGLTEKVSVATVGWQPRVADPVWVREEAGLPPGQTVTYTGGACTVDFEGDLDCTLPDQTDANIDILYLTLEIDDSVPVGDYAIVARAATSTVEDQSGNNTAVAMLQVRNAPVVVPPVTGPGGGGGSGGSGGSGGGRGGAYGDGDLAKTGTPIEAIVLYGMVLIAVGVLVRFGPRQLVGRPAGRRPVRRRPVRRYRLPA
ncbi:Ig-like domain-containing protein [Virgisporangium ochraceum]